MRYVTRDDKESVEGEEGGNQKNENRVDESLQGEYVVGGRDRGIGLDERGKRHCANGRLYDTLIKK